MAYLLVSDFKYGMDRRRPRQVSVPGTLWTLKNAVITRGGDIEGAKKFVSTYSLPAGETFGLADNRGQLFCFGSNSTPAAQPYGVQYQRLQAASANMTAVLDARLFGGKLYVIAEFDNGGVYHFYDGTRVSAWDTVGALTGSDGWYAAAALLAKKINAESGVSARAFNNVVYIESDTPGTAFTLATAVVNGGGTPTATSATVTANVVAVAEVLASGTVTVTGGSTSTGGANRIDQVTADGNNLIASPVEWVSSNAATANALANAINNYSLTSGYYATVVGAVVTIQGAPGTGATLNSDIVAATVAGDVTVSTANFSGGVTAVVAVAQVSKVTVSGSSFNVADSWTITVNGTGYTVLGLGAGTGRSIFVHKKRVWSPSPSGLWYCKLNDPTNWTDTTASTGAGTLVVSTDSEGAQTLVVAAPYNGKAAIFSENNIVIYQLDTDTANIAVQDTLENAGALAARAVVAFGNTDVFYPDQTGVRSIRSRDGYDAAYVGDVGNAIDEYFAELVADIDEYTLTQAVAAIEPTGGRYMLVLGGAILVLSYFPSSNITAWSFIEPGFTITDLVRSRRRLYARAGDTVYLYGGADGVTYPDEDEQATYVLSGYMSANDPAGIKQFQAFDVALDGDWSVNLLVDPNDTTASVEVGVINKTTFGRPPAFVPGRTALLAFEATCASAGKRTLSSLAIHYEKSK